MKALRSFLRQRRQRRFDLAMQQIENPNALDRRVGARKGDAFRRLGRATSSTEWSGD
jgi:hypothetical protein